MKFDYAIKVLRGKKRNHNYCLKYRSKNRGYVFSAYGKALDNEDKKNIKELEVAIRILQREDRKRISYKDVGLHISDSPDRKE